MKRILIVNADDCNLTPGVTRAILDCHENGIVTSTTFLINRPLEEETVKRIKKAKRLGVGVHLNVTLGLKPPRNAEVLFREYQNQIRKFQRIFGKRPTHLDTHHQLHDQPFFFRVLAEVAKKNHLPIRRSRLMTPTLTLPLQDEGGGKGRGEIQTTDYLFGNLSPSGYWREETLVTLLRNFPEGTSEIMCHPGRNDAVLCSISSFTTGREAEWQLFRSPDLQKMARELGIELSHYGLCYNLEK